MLNDEWIAGSWLAAARERNRGGGVPTVTYRDGQITTKPFHASAFHRAALQQRAQLIV